MTKGRLIVGTFSEVMQGILYNQQDEIRYRFITDGHSCICHYLEERDYHTMILFKDSLDTTGSWSEGDTMRAGMKLIEFREESVKVIGL